MKVDMTNMNATLTRLISFDVTNQTFPKNDRVDDRNPQRAPLQGFQSFLVSRQESPIYPQPNILVL